MKLKLFISLLGMFVASYAFSSVAVTTNNTTSGMKASMGVGIGNKEGSGSKISPDGGAMDWLYSFFRSDADSSASKSDTLKTKANTQKKSYPSLDRVVY